MTTVPALASGSWSRLFLALLASWNGDAGPDADGAGVPQPVFERLSGLDAEARDERLFAFRRFAATCAERYVHPSWCRAVLFPTPFPWRPFAARPSTYLWALPPDDALAVLRRHGLRPLASVARELARTSPRRLGALVYDLSEADRRQLAARVRSASSAGGETTDDAAWAEELERLVPAASGAGPDVPLALARVELVARAAGGEGGGGTDRDDGAAAEDLLRLAYRLPAASGAPLVGELSRGLRDPSRLPLPASDEAELAADVEALAVSGDVTLPSLDRLRRELAR